MRTNIEINDTLMQKAIAISGLSTKKETVEEALKMLIQIKSQEKIKSLKGKINWQGNLDQSRAD